MADKSRQIEPCASQAKSTPSANAAPDLTTFFVASKSRRLAGPFCLKMRRSRGGLQTDLSTADRASTRHTTPLSPHIRKSEFMASCHRAISALALLFASVCVSAQPAAPTGEIKGAAWVHTKDSLAAAIQQADICLPAAATGGASFCGKFKDLPKVGGKPVPVLVFLHGSSGLGLKAIAEWQQWLASLGYASIAPDSFALADRVTYKSPIDKDSYERIHALRASEIASALSALKGQPWVDFGNLVLAGTSEGSVPVARYQGNEFVARIMYAWSCESNYFVVEPRNNFEPGKPVLNVISASDPFFSKSNTWLNSPDAQGHCGAALKDNSRASVLLVPNAPHTLLNLSATRSATAGFLSLLTKP
jgi:dienelactone hydrolase